MVTMQAGVVTGRVVDQRVVDQRKWTVDQSKLDGRSAN
jgi:hypothetical protein